MRPDAALLLLLAVPAWAEGGLEDREVLFRVESWDDPARPYLVSRDYAARVGPGAEFALRPDMGGGLVVVGAEVDLSGDRVDIRLKEDGAFAPSAFNGYVLTFPLDCALLLGAALDPAATTLALPKDAVVAEPQALRVDVAGLAFRAGDRIGVTLEVADCPLS